MPEPLARREFAVNSDCAQRAVDEVGIACVGITMSWLLRCHRWDRDSLGSGNERA